MRYELWLRCIDPTGLDTWQFVKAALVEVREANEVIDGQVIRPASWVDKIPGYLAWAWLVGTAVAGLVAWVREGGG